MSRDDRPYFHGELGIPWDEYQLACVISTRNSIFFTSLSDSETDDLASRIARRASRRLRRGHA